MKHLLLCLLIVTSFVSINIGCSSKTQTTTTEETESVNIEVTDASWVKIDNIVLPQLTANVPSDVVDNINDEIKNLHDGYLTEQDKTWKEQDGGHGPQAEYRVFRNKDVLSIVVRFDGAGYSTPNWQYSVFNICEGRSLDMTELLEHFNISRSDVSNIIKTMDDNSEGTIDYYANGYYPVYIKQNKLMMILTTNDLPYGNGSETRPHIIIEDVLNNKPMVKESEEKSSLDIDELQVTTQEGTSMPDRGLFKRYTNAGYGITVEMKDGEVFINYDIEKLQNQFGSDILKKNITDKRYKIKGLVGKCVALFVGDMGQDIYPVLVMLLDDGRVQKIDLFGTFQHEEDTLLLQCGQPIEGLKDIVSFTNEGAGEYENEGQKCFSYIAIFAIDKEGNKHEIIPF